MRKQYGFILSSVLAALVSAVGCIGCGTSAAFKAGAAASGPYIQRVTDHYVDADASIDSAEKSAREAKTATLLAATSGANVTVEGVDAAWAAVRPYFYAYTDADAKLSRVRATTRPGVAALSDRDIIQGVGRRLDTSIASERARLLRWVTPAASGEAAK